MEGWIPFQARVDLANGSFEVAETAFFFFFFSPSCSQATERVDETRIPKSETTQTLLFSLFPPSLFIFLSVWASSVMGFLLVEKQRRRQKVDRLTNAGDGSMSGSGDGEDCVG